MDDARISGRRTQVNQAYLIIFKSSQDITLMTTKFLAALKNVNSQYFLVHNLCSKPFADTKRQIDIIAK